ncbi:nucleolar transcription factor 1 isoform X2 [Corvus cornix cornix]|uniref:Nucleolar transcription factor 1 n=1 Tax=Corvus moneduloides TaxID=1196302 RepID=A0A8C3GRX7_CORMO|nr:nucleolar transcription factor 1 isoform X2 [Parus major]XP_031947466.1 nucleolar transcription factor 1 isoform X2 [Corvus moneduloides]XP_039420463.1 nucleolar transcription factor 1 isoform X2 [Corvus cornix cornix]XP_041870610.1 nucleolar transcription factor 1 isoform X2 [Corvus kubaryi]XP_048175377.1 nucleolar transcription factor 1 isoform X2 [Corvus hawaiiensis]XP_058713705.1 nucleolar transcription factor 1 isoform X2 [Poecile atricapillus]
MNGEAECPADLEMTAPKNQDRWSQEDMLTLLECMKNNLPSNDGSKFKTTESHLDWEKVAFKDFSGEMCKMKWMEISNEVRKFRTLTELIMDAEEHVKNPYKGKKLKKHPDFPKKPLTPYFRFFMEKRAKYAKLHPEMSNLDLTKILSKKYKELPEKKKMKYIQDFQREKQEFERNLARFREDHPDLIQNAKKSDVPEKPKTPQQLWYNHEKKIYLKVRPDATTKEVKESLGKQWSQLSDKKRLKWIHKALEQRKEYEEIMRDYIQKHPELNISEEGITRSTLTKAERQLKDKFDGRPTKPPPNSYSLYCAELMANMKDVPSTERMVLCSQQWKLLSQKEKDAYHKKCDQKKKDYEIELLRFLESLPEEEQQRVLGEEKMLGSNRKGATSPASKKSSPETGKASSEKPKRPISAMFIFSEEKRKQLQEERPELSESELTRLLARMWNDLSEKKKAKYKAREAAMKAQSEKKHGSDKEERGKLPESPKTAEEIWQQSVIGDYLARFKNDRGKALKAMEATWNNMEKKEKLMWIKKAAEDQKRYERELSEMRAPPCSTNSTKKMKFQGEPKKPPMNGYQKFSQELLSNGELNHLPLKERMVEIGSRWQRISQGQKDHYKKLAEEQQKQYKVHLDIWLKSLSPQERAAYKEHISNKRKSIGKIRGPNPKMKPTMQSKSESEDDDEEEEEEEDDDEDEDDDDDNGDSSEEGGDSSESSSEEESEDGDECECRVSHQSQSFTPVQLKSEYAGWRWGQKPCPCLVLATGQNDEDDEDEDDEDEDDNDSEGSSSSSSSSGDSSDSDSN